MTTHLHTDKNTVKQVREHLHTDENTLKQVTAHPHTDKNTVKHQPSLAVVLGNYMNVNAGA